MEVLEKNGQAAPKPEGTLRDTLFISHATPGDNAFATWLAFRLSMAGYEVWCDQDKLLGAEDFWQDIETVLRGRAIKFVLVISQNAFDENDRLRDGIQKELALANIIKKKIGDEYFVVPMRIDDTSFSDFSIDFIRLNGIDCATNWATGFHSLLKVLERDEVTRTPDRISSSLKAWRQIHQHHTRAISQEKEILQSNRLPIQDVPQEIYFYEFLGSVKANEPRAIASDCPLPCTDHHRLLASFADVNELQVALGDHLPIKVRGKLSTIDFLNGRTGDIVGIEPRDARNKLSSMVRQAWDMLMEDRGLRPYEMANGKLAWWFPVGLIEDGQLRFTDFNGKPRRRAVSGTRGKKDGPDGVTVPRYYWHLGFTSKPYIGDQSCIILQPRIIISEDGKTPLKSKTRLNSVRRSLTSMWFNDKWRGLVLGFASWLADNNENFVLPVSNSATFSIGGNPISFQSPVGIKTDPVSFDLTDELGEEMEDAEMQMRLSDPAFVKIVLSEDED